MADEFEKYSLYKHSIWIDSHFLYFFLPFQPSKREIVQTQDLFFLKSQSHLLFIACGMNS